MSQRFMFDSMKIGTSRLPSALFTDLYQLTMAQAYLHSRQTAQATFGLFFRSYPDDLAYYIFVGLESVIAFLTNMSFSKDEIEYLRDLEQFNDEFLGYLSRFRFTGTVRAMQEGTIFFPNEPVIEVTGPVVEAQIVETLLLNHISAQSLLATRASRVVQAARGRPVVDYGARRTHGAEAGLEFARASYIAGYAGSSLVQAGKVYNIPIFGTMAHSFVTSFPKEADSFRAYADSFPETTTLLVDTYSTIAGTREAIKVGVEMRQRGRALRAIRLDSGNLLDLSRQCRIMLDEAGLNDVQILVSGGLDEFEIDRLVSSGGPIDGFGVGTKVNVSADASSMDTVYKLSEYNGRPVIKLSEKKETLPGTKQVYRCRDRKGFLQKDVITLSHEALPSEGAEPLLTEIVTDGKRSGSNSDLTEVRRRCATEIANLPEEYKHLRSPARYQVTISSDLRRLQERLSRQAVV